MRSPPSSGFPLSPRSALLALATLAALSAGPARADAVPDLDVEKTCKSAQKASVSISDNASYEGCLRSENAARKEAERRWGDYSSAAKAQCQAQFKAGGYPSYVEMVTCLELASGTVPTQTGLGGEANSGPGANGAKASPQENKQQSVTQEPSPSQRTNPIEVLDRK